MFIQIHKKDKKYQNHYQRIVLVGTPSISTNINNIRKSYLSFFHMDSIISASINENAKQNEGFFKYYK